MAKPESDKDKHKDKHKSKPSAQAGQDKPKKPKDKPKPSCGGGGGEGSRRGPGEGEGQGRRRGPRPIPGSSSSRSSTASSCPGAAPRPSQGADGALEFGRGPRRRHRRGTQVPSRGLEGLAREAGPRAVGQVALPVDLQVHPRLDDRVLGQVVGPRHGLDSRISTSRPVASRRTANCGCTTRCSARPCWPSSAVTESTRNGMSSVTISTHGVAGRPAVLVDGRGEDPDVRRTDRSLLGERLVAQRRAEQVLGLRASRSSVATCL